MNRDIMAERGADCLYSILHDYQSFWFVIPETLERRVGFEKAFELFHKGVVWRVFDGGMTKEEEDRALQNLRERGLENEELGYYELVMLWAQHYLSTAGIDQSDDENEGEDGGGNEKDDDDSTEGAKAVDSGLLTEGWPYGDAIYERMLFKVFGIGSHSTGKDFFATDSRLVGQSDHPIQSQYDGQSREGDIVCVLQKCTRPVISRPCEDGRFQLVSFAYVHDVFEDSDTAIDLSTREGEWFELR